MSDKHCNVWGFLGGTVLFLFKIAFEVKETMTILTSASWKWLQRAQENCEEREEKEGKVSNYGTVCYAHQIHYNPMWLTRNTKLNSRDPFNANLILKPADYRRTHTYTHLQFYLTWHVIWNTTRPNCDGRVALQRKGNQREERDTDTVQKLIQWGEK